MRDFLRKISGMVTLIIEGENKERFINLCKNKNVIIYNIDTKKEGFEIDIPTCALYDVKSIRSKCRVKIKIKKKKGIIIFLRKQKNIYSFILGLIMYFGIIIFLQGNIYDIEIKGCEKYNETDILNYLSDMGVKKGINKKKINLKDIEFAIRDNYYGIIWVSAYTDGSKLLVEIKESEYN